MVRIKFLVQDYEWYPSGDYETCTPSTGQGCYKAKGGTDISIKTEDYNLVTYFESQIVDWFKSTLPGEGSYWKQEYISHEVTFGDEVDLSAKFAAEFTPDQARLEREQQEAQERWVLEEAMQQRERVLEREREEAGW